MGVVRKDRQAKLQAKNFTLKSCVFRGFSYKNELVLSILFGACLTILEMHRLLVSLGIDLNMIFFLKKYPFAVQNAVKCGNSECSSKISI